MKRILVSLGIWTIYLTALTAAVLLITSLADVWIYLIGAISSLVLFWLIHRCRP